MPVPPPQPARNETPSEHSNTRENNRSRPGCKLKWEPAIEFLRWCAAAFEIWAYAFKVVISPWMSFSDPPRPVGQNPFSNYSRRMRNKLNNKTASKCQRTSPEVAAALRLTICMACGLDSSDIRSRGTSPFISLLDATNPQVVACYLLGWLVAELRIRFGRPQLFRAFMASHRGNVRRLLTSTESEPQHFQF